MPVNFEFKAQHPDIAELENRLLSLDPVFIGEDHQVDTYFQVPNGRLKWREGAIENALIFYHRTDVATTKQSNVVLYENPPELIKEMLVQSLGVLIIVDKIRRIYFIDNVKFHCDTVAGLGTFVEVEAIDKQGIIPISHLQEQCMKFQTLFDLTDDNMIASSYSDLLLAKLYSLP